jgi:hypothetical protein
VPYAVANSMVPPRSGQGAPPEVEFSSDARRDWLLIQEARALCARLQQVGSGTRVRPTECRPELPFPLTGSVLTVIEEVLRQECDSIFSEEVMGSFFPASV